MKRYIYKFNLRHTPSCAAGVFSVPAENSFEANALLTKLLGKQKMVGEAECWNLNGTTAVLDTSFPKDARLKEFGICNCENYRELHFLGHECVGVVGAQF